MASSACSIFDRLSPAPRLLSSLALLGAIMCTSTGPSTSASDFSSTLSSRSMQLRLVQALKQKGQYSVAAMFLGAVDLNHVLPESSTILVPMDEDVVESGLEYSTFNTAMPILQYHVLVKRLVFHELQQFPVGQTLPTLLLNNTVIITSNSSLNFTVDDVPMSHRNLFVASSTVVHGMNGVLNPAVYGSMTHFPDVPEPSSPRSGMPGRDGGGSSPASAPFSSNNPDNGTKPSSSLPPAISTDGPFPPSSTPALPGSNASSPSPATPVSLPSPSTPHRLNPSPAPPTPIPSTPRQEATPLLQSSCAVAFGATFSSCGMVFLIMQLFVSVLFIIAGLFELPRLPILFCIMILPIVAALSPATGHSDVEGTLKSVGNFDYAATFLGAIDLHRFLPTRSTVLLPTDAAIETTGLMYNTLGAALPVLQYHVITRELSFRDLQMLPTGEMLETILPKASVLVTSNTPWNFTLNNVLLSHPDIFCLNGTIMHGIAGVMNYSQLLSSTLPTPTGQPFLGQPSPPQITLPLPEAAEPAIPVPVSNANLIAENEMIGKYLTRINQIISVFYLISM